MGNSASTVPQVIGGRHLALGHTVCVCCVPVMGTVRAVTQRLVLATAEITRQALTVRSVVMGIMEMQLQAFPQTVSLVHVQGAPAAP